ncbi:sulfurtransferase TusA family protein [uncultured Sphingomonas sp.]|uniref:sulfurtransferase TusA family protein n=1 Tax=uncultured Sphingomonas sp. TaxID=158754 RepID=UPI0025D470C7|nr:sulfurtransferase TusA family protein [uncultured Sphingomonas sp.]
MTSVDARGLLCPWPALRLARAMRDVDQVMLLTDDPTASDEIRALATAHGWICLPHDGGIQVTRPAR